MATFQFTTNLGSDLTLVSGKAYFYGLSNSNGETISLGEQTVNGPDFTASINTSGCTYFYVVLGIDSYRTESTNGSEGNRVLLLLSIFRTDTMKVSIGERETIANLFCFAPFAVATATAITITASNREMEIMYGMRNNFIRTDGTLSGVISSSPNGMETNSYSMFNFLANLLYYCITDSTTYYDFTALSTSSDTPALNTFDAFLNMVANPWNQVEAIYDLVSDKPPVYTPWLPGMYTQDQMKEWSPVPNQWTLTVKFNDSGAQNFLIGGPAYIAFDENDRLWLTNNSTQGTPNSGTFCIILDPDGSPASFSPVSGGGLLGGGFGVCANADGDRIIFGNYGWGPKQYNPQTGSISAIESNGSLLSPSQGYTSGLSRVQGVIYDNDGNLWMASWGSQEPMAPSNETVYDFPDQNSAVVVYVNFDGSREPMANEVATYEFETPSPFNGTFNVAFDNEGNAFVSNSGGKSPGGKNPDDTIVPSSVYKVRLDLSNPNSPSIQMIAKWTSDQNETLRQVNVNSRGEVFVASVGGGCVIKFDNDLNLITRITDTIGKPWGVSFDAEDTMYASNFFALHEAPPAEGEKDVRGIFGVTVFKDGQTTAEGIMNLPTGGSQVMLANGYPLYGSGNPSSYQPLSRLTSSVFDRVGNLWAINNWKPSAYIDFESNPGGDGVVAFVGVGVVGSES